MNQQLQEKKQDLHEILKFKFATDFISFDRQLFIEGFYELSLQTIKEANFYDMDANFKDQGCQIKSYILILIIEQLNNLEEKFLNDDFIKEYLAVHYFCAICTKNVIATFPFFDEVNDALKNQQILQFKNLKTISTFLKKKKKFYEFQFMDFLRSQICTLSIQILDIYQKKLGINLPIYEYIKSFEFKGSKIQFEVLPTFLSIKVVMEIFKKRQIPFMFGITTYYDDKQSSKNIFIKRFNESGKLIQNEQNINQNAPLYMINMLRRITPEIKYPFNIIDTKEFLNQLELNLPLDQVIYSVLSIHNQFPDEELDKTFCFRQIDLNNEYHHYKELSVRNGMNIGKVVDESDRNFDKRQIKFYPKQIPLTIYHINVSSISEEEQHGFQLI